jgi:5-methylcytosine-specific restriction endonuclease McrA
MRLRRYIKREVENLRDLSPLVLKRKIENLRRQIAAAEAAVPQAREKDLQEYLSARQRWETARINLIQVKAELEQLSREIEQNHKPMSTFGVIVCIILDFFEIDRPAGLKLSDAEIISHRKHEQLKKRFEALRNTVGSSDPIPSSYENPYFKQTPIPFHEEDEQRRLDYVNDEMKQTPRNFNEADAQRRVDHIKSELERHLEALGGDTARLERLEAVEARVIKKERELATKLRLTFKPTDKCLYCDNPLGINPHLDHIYPVSKGGLSVSTNLIFVCLQCNQRKSDKTLAAFLNSYNLDRQAVEARLRQLGKEF